MRIPRCAAHVTARVAAIRAVTGIDAKLLLSELMLLEEPSNRKPILAWEGGDGVISDRNGDGMRNSA